MSFLYGNVHFSVIFVPLFLRNQSFSRHSGACGLRVHPSTVRPTRWLAPESPRSGMTGLQITPPPTGTCYSAQMFELKFPRNPEFSRNSRAMGRECTCMDYTPKKKYPAEEGTAAAFSIRQCAFSVIFVPYSRKPEFSRHSGACGLRVPPFYCKTH